MSPLDQYIITPPLQQLICTLFQIEDFCIIFIIKCDTPGFYTVGGDNHCLRKQHFPHRTNNFFICEYIPAPGSQYRIEYQWNIRIIRNDFRNSSNNFDTAQHPDFEGLYRHILQHSACLINDPLSIQHENILYASCILNGYGSDDRKRMT